MRSEDRALARKQLDKRLNFVRSTDALTRPPRGWIKAIREALGMTTAQIARRMGVSQPRAVEIEKAEKTGAITLDTLERAARAMDCRLVYAFVPKKLGRDVGPGGSGQDHHHPGLTLVLHPLRITRANQRPGDYQQQ